MKRAQARIDELLTARATEGIAPEAERELDALLAAVPDTDAGAFDRAAAAIHLAALVPREPLPPTVRARLERAAGTARGRG